MNSGDTRLQNRNLGSTQKSEENGLDLPQIPESVIEAIAHGIAGAYLAVHAFVQASKSPTVLQTLAKVSKTIIITAAVQYLLLLITLWPINLILRLVGFLIKQPLKLGITSSAASCMFIYPLVTMKLVKMVYRQHLAVCFFDTLMQLDPVYASELAARGRAFRKSWAGKMQDKLVGAITESEDDLKTVVLLTLAAPLLRLCRGLPYFGRLAVAVAQFIGISFTVGRPYAAGLLTLLVALVPTTEGTVMSFVGLWASSKALGHSSLRHFMDRSIPGPKQGAFIKTFELTIVSYFMLPTYLLRWPVVGALAAFPAASMAAYSVKDIMSRPGVREAMSKLEISSDSTRI